MAGFTLTGTAAAPVEEVWKLLFDPLRFPEWWAGIDKVRVESADVYTAWSDGYPDFPMPQRLRADRGAGRVTISCQVSEFDFSWQLTEHGHGTEITVRVAAPPEKADQLDGEREFVAASLTALAELAEGQAYGR